MTCLDIFEIVAALIGEDADDSGADLLKKRLPALISTAACELFELDRAYRKYVLCEIVSDGDGPEPIHSLDDESPVTPRLVPTLAFYVSALLIRDENSALAEMLSRDYANSRDAIASSIPAHSSVVRDRYAGF